MSYMISVDVGGTFTDCIVAEEGRTTFGKSLSTPPDFEKGIMDSVASAVENMGMSFDEVMSNTMLFFSWGNGSHKHNGGPQGIKGRINNHKGT